MAVVSFYVEDCYQGLAGTPAEIELLYVLPEARGVGVGRCFAQQLVEHYGTLGGECCKEHRARFFERAGFEVSRLGGSHTFFRKPTTPRPAAMPVARRRGKAVVLKA